MNKDGLSGKNMAFLPRTMFSWLKVNDVGGAIKKSNAAAKAARESLGESATAKQKAKVARHARFAVASQDLKDRMHAKFEAAGREGGTGFSMLDKAAQQFGFTKSSGSMAGGGGGGSSGAYGQTGQTKEGHYLSTTSNPDFKTATTIDSKTGQSRSMTNQEFQTEKVRQGVEVGLQSVEGGSQVDKKKMRKAIDEQNSKKTEQNSSLPDNLTEEERATKKIISDNLMTRGIFSVFFVCYISLFAKTVCYDII